MTSINRRIFFRQLGLGALSLGPLARRATEAPLEAGRPAERLAIKRYKHLGKTGLMVSDVSCGAIMLSGENVLRYAHDCGVNYFDTAEGYMRGQSEVFLGRAFKGTREKLIITTKHVPNLGQGWNKTTIIQRVEASLKRLQTDYVDIAMVHGVADPQLLDDSEILGAYTQLIQDGKIRFAGYSTHNAPLLLGRAQGSDIFRIALVIYNHMEGKAIEPLIERAKNKGMGIIAMKVMAGSQQGILKGLVNDKLSYPQAAIRWVLANPSVDCCIVSMASYNHVEEYVAASGQPLKREDLRVIARYQQEAGPLFCRVSCSQCRAACPQNVAINDILRYAMYFENYGMEKEAMRYYAGLDDAKKPLDCQRCAGPCGRACPYGLPVRERLIHSHAILTV
jgi:aryl-alcohol dehydrogenase-like predicted oxidoreductase